MVAGYKYRKKKQPAEPSEAQVKRQASVSKKVAQLQEKFLEAFVEADGDISLAAGEAGINRCTHYDWMKSPEYATKFRIYQEAIEDREKQVFLAAYLKNQDMSISRAAKTIGISREKHYKWLRQDEKYAEQFRQVQVQMGDVLEEEAFRRAVQGTEEPVFYKDRVCGTIRRFSDSLLAKMLAARKPELYRDKATEVNIHNNITTQLAEAVSAGRERVQHEGRISDRIGTDS